jgi:hypothetical protein
VFVSWHRSAEPTMGRRQREHFWIDCIMGIRESWQLEPFMTATGTSQSEVLDQLANQLVPN